MASRDHDDGMRRLHVGTGPCGQAREADRDAYLKVKRELAQRAWRHVQHYAGAKSAIVEQIVARAAATRRSRRADAAS